jgi:site-specific DNA recombinase
VGPNTRRHRHRTRTGRILPWMRAGSPKSAAIYARISHDPSGERLGVQRQEADCLEEAKRRGWSVAQVYVDDDLSAFNPKKPRPEYQRLLSDIQLGSRDGVMIWRLDRLHRQPRELEEFIVLCDKHQVALATVTGDVDLSTSQGRLLARAWGAFAAHENDVKSERMRRANLERARRGLARTAWRPYGFKGDGRTVIPTEATIIKEAATRVLRGESVSSICVDFNRRGIPSARGGDWRTPPLRRILASGRAAGWSTYHGEVVGKSLTKGILTHRQTERLTALFSDPARRTSGGAHGWSLLNGSLACGRCGQYLHAGHHGRVRTYRCDRQPGGRGCGRISIGMDALDDYFMGQLHERLDSEALPAALLRGKLSDAKWRKARSALDAAEARLRTMARDFAKGSLTRLEWQAARPALLERVDVMRAALRQDRAEDLILEFIGDADRLWAQWDDLEPSRKRAIAAALVTEIAILPATKTRSQVVGRVLIWWRDEEKPRRPRGSGKGIAERRAAGDFDHCSVPSCAQPYAANGYCSLHLQRVRHHGSPGQALALRLGPYRGSPCLVEGCDRGARSVGRCSMHYQQWLRDNPNGRRCLVEDCEANARVSMWCIRHYRRLQSSGTTDLRPRATLGPAIRLSLPSQPLRSRRT